MNTYKSILKIFFLAVSGLVFLTNYTFGQTTFLKSIGDKGINRGVTVEEVYETGFIVTGYSTRGNSGSEDVLLVRTDSSGDTIWTKTFGGKEKDNGWAVRQTSDSGFIITGYTSSFGAGGMDIYVIRTDAEGDTIWTKTFGGDGEEYSWDIRKTVDEGYIIAAQTSSLGNGEIDACLLKIDSDGNQEWSKTYGGKAVDRIFSVRQTPDGGYIAAGITYSFGAVDRNVYLIKTNASGEMEWFKTFGGEAYDVGHSVTLTSDGGYLIAGYGESFSTHGKRDVYLIKTDANGQMEWLKTYGGSENDRAMKGFQTKDGGYIAIGFTIVSIAGYYPDWDVYLVKTDAEGNTLWTRTYGDREQNDFGYTVQETDDGGYILTGQSENFERTKSSLLLIKTDSEGRSQQVEGRSE